MNIGDKVRVIHGTEEGIVVRVLPDGLVEIEIEDGFTIPVLIRDLVIIQPGLQDIKQDKKAPLEEKKPVGQKGLFLGIHMKTQDMVEVFFINNTEQALLLAGGKSQKESYKGLCTEKVKGKSYFKIDQTTFQRLQEEQFIFEYIVHEPTKNSLPRIFSKKVRAKASSLQKAKTNAPLINQEMHLIQLDADAIQVDAQSLQEQLTERKESKPIDNTPSKGLKKEVDLHIEAITDDHEFLSSEEKLIQQIATFEKTLDNAIAFGLDEITFIHGVGNGKLRMEIHKLLSKNSQVAWFKDAAKEKFGYGATLVKIK